MLQTSTWTADPRAARGLRHAHHAETMSEHALVPLRSHHPVPSPGAVFASALGEGRRLPASLAELLAGLTASPFVRPFIFAVSEPTAPPVSGDPGTSCVRRRLFGDRRRAPAMPAPWAKGDASRRRLPNSWAPSMPVRRLHRRASKAASPFVRPGARPFVPAPRLRRVSASRGRWAHTNPAGSRPSCQLSPARTTHSPAPCDVAAASSDGAWICSKFRAGAGPNPQISGGG